MHDRENCAHGLAISLSLQRLDWKSGRVCTSKRASEGKKGIIPSSLFPLLKKREEQERNPSVLGKLVLETRNGVKEATNLLLRGKVTECLL